MVEYIERETLLDALGFEKKPDTYGQRQFDFRNHPVHARRRRCAGGA